MPEEYIPPEALKEFTQYGVKKENETAPREKLAQDVRDIIEREDFVFDPDTHARIEMQVAQAKRYIFAVGKRQEGGVAVERFLKIPVNDNPEIDEPFKRQIEFSKFLKKDGRIKTRGVIEANTDRKQGSPFAVMETFREDEARIGFISGAEDMEFLTNKEAQSCIKTLETLQEIDTSDMTPEFKECLQKVDMDAQSLIDEIMNNLEEKVVPEDTEKEELYHEVLNRRFGITDFKDRVIKLLEYLKDTLKEEDDKEEVLVHGDLAPNNLYVYDNGDVEFLDLEWAGITKNKAIGTVIDFGNLRARAWNNKEFREGLDIELLDGYKKNGKEKLGRAVASLGILRSHMGLAGFFENYDLEKQRREEQKNRRESTEADIVKAWEIAGLKF